MAGNKALMKAKDEKQDEFYTQLVDIEKELRHYKKHFKDKVVLCNCDDPFESNFFKYFVLNFNKLGLKRLIATCYDGSPIAGEQLALSDIGKNTDNKAYKAIINTVYDKTGDGAIDMFDIVELFKSGENELTELVGNGDFRSEECEELLKESDVVVTNPPFSLFREYIKQLLDNKKQFVIIGNQNAITYKEIFPLLKDNLIWLGYCNGDMAFRVPDYFEPRATRFWIDEKGQKWRSMGNIAWYTNLDIKKRHEEIILIKKYNEEEYPKYDNYDAIEVSRTVNIPLDYEGMMGVPITFLDKYNPDQFEIIGIAKRGAGDPALRSHVYTKEEYHNYSDLNAGPTIWVDGNLKNLFPRILIKNKKPEK